MSGHFKNHYPSPVPDFINARNFDAYNGNALGNMNSPLAKHAVLAAQSFMDARRPLLLSRGGHAALPQQVMGVPMLMPMAMHIREGRGASMRGTPPGMVRPGSSPVSRGLITHAVQQFPHLPGQHGVPLPRSEQSQGKKRRHNNDSPVGGEKHSRVDSPTLIRVSGQIGMNPNPESPMTRIMGEDEMSEAIWQYFLRHVQSSEDYEKKKLLRNSLYQVLQGVFPYCGLYIVGSSLSGFATRKSDVDMCLMLSGDYIDQKREATEILFLIHRAVRKCSFVRESEVIRAKVPILKFRDSVSCFECDLNINNSVGIRNTHLLRYYANADPRVRPLMLFIKHWARFQDINDARKMTISSFSLGLMLVHYLQVGCKPPVLPSLQQIFPEKFNTDTDVRDLRLDEKLPIPSQLNRMSLGELFLGFLEYYCYEFDFSKDVISVREGRKLNRSDVTAQVSNPGQWKYLCVEEPFDRSNTARAVYDPYTFQRICRVFRVSYENVKKTRDVKHLFRDPF